MRATAFILSLYVSMGAAIGLRAAGAQEYPATSIRVIVPFPPGAASDVSARMVFERMGRSFGQRFVIENRPGAGGYPATSQAAKMPPDGYNLLFVANSAIAATKKMNPSIDYDARHDFEPISLITNIPFFLAVSAKLPVTNMKEFLELAKRDGLNLTYSSLGIGTGAHVSGARFAEQTNIPMRHITYRASAQLVSDLVSGEVPVNFTGLSTVAGQVAAGQVRLLAVADDKRFVGRPDIPTMAEVGVPDMISRLWLALLAPKGTPRPIIDKLNREVSAALADPELAGKIVAAGGTAVPTSPEGLGQIISDEIDRTTVVLDRLGIKIEK